MDETTYLDFLNSTAESFAEVLGPLVEDGDVSGQDIYSVLAEFAGQR